MRSIQLHEFNILMGEKVYLPNVSGMLMAYALSMSDISDNYIFQPVLFVRGLPEKIMDKWINPDVLAFSSSMWNHQLNLFLAEQARKRFPKALIIFGGPHVQTLPEELLKNYTFIDVVVIGEGERTFAEILIRFNQSDGRKDFSNISGLVFRSSIGNLIKESPGPLLDVNSIPSPYLGGLYDDILDSHQGYDFQLILETNRGCPFHCSFCYWGNGITRVRNFDLGRVMNEIDWLSNKGISYVFGADANFGMFPRDIDIAAKFVDVKQRNGSPESFRVCYGKNNVERVFDTAKLLDHNGLTKGVTVSFQSVDPHTLNLVGRKNISVDAYRELLKKYRQARISVYTELILGLPGETYESFARGLEEIFQAGMYDQSSVFMCQALPGTEITDPEYMKKHEIKTRRIKLVEIHSSARLLGEVQEYEDVIVSTSSMSTDDWRRMVKLSWLAQAFHGLKLGFFVSLYLFKQFGVKYVDLLEYVMTQGNQPERFPIIAREITYFDEYIDGLLESGNPQCVFLEEFGEISWQIEEATFLRLSNHLEGFYDELLIILSDFSEEENVNCSVSDLKEVISYQKARMATFNLAGSEIFYDFSRTIPSYFQSLLIDSEVEIIPGKQRIQINHPSFKSKPDFAKQVVWFGRRHSRTVLPAIVS